MRLILLLHRYLGVLVGALMLMWCLSGFVMMYAGYPHLDEATRLKGLAPLSFAVAPVAPTDLAGNADVAGFRVETIGRRPVVRVMRGPGREEVFDLATGASIDGFEAKDALAVAQTFAEGVGVTGRPVDLGLIDADQWTVEGAGRRGPLHHIRFDDPAGTELYVAETTGDVVQMTTRASRFWGWLGAVPHWLYPLVLRRNGVLWDQVVIWTSLTGVFLTLTGLYVGISRLRPRAEGRWSPYKGWFWWHHMLGLAFGVLTLAWVASGLFSMNPWGLFESPAGYERAAWLAGPLSGRDVKQALTAAARLAPRGLVRLDDAALGGRPYALARLRDDSVVRVDLNGEPRPLQTAELRQAVAALGGAAPIEFTLLTHEDAYYYKGFDSAAPLPAYRIAFGDAAATTLYVDATSGAPVRGVDRIARQSRWLRTGLHDWDFGVLRARPLWDVVVLALLSGVTAACAVGLWLAVGRVIRDLSALRRLIGRIGRTKGFAPPRRVL